MEELTTKMAEYVCDHVCGKIKGLAEDDAAETCDACKMDRFIIDICNLHNKEVQKCNVK